MSCHKRPSGRRRRELCAAVAKRDGTRCLYCGQDFGPELAGATLDHLFPVCRFRYNQPPNLVLACASCNNAKGDTDPHVFLGIGIAALARRCGYREQDVAAVLADPSSAGSARLKKVTKALRQFAEWQRGPGPAARPRPRPWAALWRLAARRAAALGAAA